MSDFHKLSEDGPMGLMHVQFMQVVLACVKTQPNNPLSSVIIEEMTQGKGIDSKPWADFVQQIIDGKIINEFCTVFFRNARVLLLADGKYDYWLDMTAWEECWNQFEETISNNYSSVMETISNNYSSAMENVSAAN